MYGNHVASFLSPELVIKIMHFYLEETFNLAIKTLGTLGDEPKIHFYCKIIKRL